MLQKDRSWPFISFSVDPTLAVVECAAVFGSACTQILKSLTFWEGGGEAGGRAVITPFAPLCVYHMTNEPYETTFPFRPTPAWKKPSA